MSDGLARATPRPGGPGRGAADVWLVHVDEPPADQAVIWSWLSEDERGKAERFHARADRQRYVMGRGVLRGVLGLALAAPPRTLAIEYDRRGKPWLAGLHQGSGVHFSVSHSGNYVLIGLVREHRIGVDIEEMNRSGDVTSIAERFLSPEETAAIQAQAGVPALEVFFRIWTRKEACAKGVGVGLAMDFDGFSATWKGDAGTCLIREHALEGWAEWSVRSLATVPGYAAAVALDSAEVVPRIAQLASLDVPA